MGHDEGLKPTYNTQRPPWVGLWSCREYKGRVDWWAEPGMKNEPARAGKFTMQRASHKEDDPAWYDAKVPDGTSNSGPLGLDRRYHKNVTAKADTPGDLAHFQQKVYEGSTQFKQLAAAFELSKEHPGVAVSPGLDSLALTPKFQLGRNAPIVNSWYHYGPRFFDQPLNEGTFWKALAAMKYTAILMVPVTMVEIKALETVKVNDFSPRTFLQRYVKLSGLPLAVAASWAVAISAAANIRNKDDVRNHLYSSLTVGAVVASAKDSLAKGTSVGLAALVLGIFWHYARVSESGLQGRLPSPTTAGIWGGPLASQLFQQGEKSVSKTVY